MKILKEGTRKLTLNVSCRVCGAEIELEPTDCYKWHGGSLGRTIVWTCPCCDRKYWRSKDDVPALFYEEVPYKRDADGK